MDCFDEEDEEDVTVQGSDLEDSEHDYLEDGQTDTEPDDCLESELEHLLEDPDDPDDPEYCEDKEDPECLAECLAGCLESELLGQQDPDYTAERVTAERLRELKRVRHLQRLLFSKSQL